MIRQQIVITEQIVTEIGEQIMKVFLLMIVGKNDNKLRLETVPPILVNSFLFFSQLAIPIYNFIIPNSNFFIGSFISKKKV